MHVWLTNAGAENRRPRITLPHASAVTSVHMLNLRVVSGSVDGKIRIWNQLTGVCLRIMRGNAAMDPITSLHFSNSAFLLVNTVTSMCMFAFETAADKALAIDRDLVSAHVVKPSKALCNPTHMPNSLQSISPPALQLVDIAKLSLEDDEDGLDASLQVASSKVHKFGTFSGSWRTSQVGVWHV